MESMVSFSRHHLVNNVVFLAFDLNKVEGHENFTHSFLLDRIEEIIAAKNKDNEEEVKQERGSDPITRFLSSTKTSWANFELICNEIGREK